MNWTPDQRLAAIDIIALKLITEQNPYQCRRGLIFIRELAWFTANDLNNHKELQEWLSPNELRTIKSY